MLISTALPFKAWALEQIRAIPELEGVQITWGWPGRSIESEWLMLGAIEWTDESWTAVGARGREEIYNVSLIVNVRRPGDSDEAAQTRVAELLGHVETWLRANALPATAIGARALTVEMIPRNLRSAPFDGGIEAQAEVDVSVKARI